MALVVASFPLDRTRGNARVNPPNKRGYLHVRKADLRVRHLREGGCPVPFAAPRIDGALLAGMLCRSLAHARAAQQRQERAGDETVRSMRSPDHRHALGRGASEVLFEGLHRGGLRQLGGGCAQKLPRRGWLLALAGHAPRRLRAGEVRRSPSGSAPSELRAPCWADSRRVSGGSSLSESGLHQPSPFGAGDRAREYPARRTRLAGRNAEALGISTRGAPWLS